MKLTQSWSRLVRTLVVLGAILGAVSLNGCGATSTMTNMWKDPSFTAPQMQNVLVVALRKDASRRRMIEDAYTAGLTKRGTKATSSYTLFPSLPDTQQVIDAVRQNGYDGVVVSVRLETTTETNYVPGYVSTYPMGGGYYGGYGYGGYGYGGYYGGYNTVVSPGYVETYDVHNYQTMVWSTKDGGRMVWTGTLQTTEDPGSRNSLGMVDSYILAEMARSGLTGKK